MHGLCMPEFTILADHSLSGDLVGNEEVDYFDFGNRLGPILDVLRHKETRMPLSMAVYGGVGTGKSTALNWLAGQIELWNEIPVAERGGHPLVVPIRFSARKCPTPAFVPKMILSELLIQSLLYMDDQVTQHRIDRMKGMAINCSSSLGKDFLKRLECLARRWGVFETLRAIITDHSSSVANEVACFDSCHALLNDSISQYANAVRMIVFIDDLDHVAPDVMMAVFEAIDVHLGSEHVGFVAALDPNIARIMIKNHFSQHEFSEMQCRHYLSKIFHVECDIEPTNQQIHDYYDAQYKLLDGRCGERLSQYVGPEHKAHIDAALLHLSSGNPRKIKVLLNSALMKGSAGVRSARSDEGLDGAESLLFVQNIQAYLLQRWLSFFSVGGGAIHREDVMNWFEFLSSEAQSPSADFNWVQKQESVDEKFRNVPSGMGFHMIHEWVWNLLKIPFSKTIASLCSDDGLIVEPVPEDSPMPMSEGLKTLSSGFVDCLAAALEKAAPELSDEDALKVTDLVLTGHRFTEQDTAFLSKLENLRRLDLHNSSIGHLDPLAGLGQLKSLNLTCTPIEDIDPLASLTGLEVLDLSFTNIKNLSPLKQCEELCGLVLFGSAVEDIEPLRGLEKLARLNLSRTQITDDQMDVLGSLPALSTLFIRETKVSRQRVAALNKIFDFNLKIEQ